MLSPLVALLADHRHVRETSREQPATEWNSPADRTTVSLIKWTLFQTTKG